jgi:hypothetical protein
VKYQRQRLHLACLLAIKYDNALLLLFLKNTHLYKKVIMLIMKAKTSFYNNKVEECQGDQKALFHLVNKLLHKGKSCALPQHDSLSELVSTFCDYFVSKIQVIRHDLAELESTTAPLSCPPISSLLPTANSNLCNFEPATEEEIIKILKQSTKATCELDPVPTSFLTQTCLNIISPCITDIVNMSLSSGTFPTDLKRALVKPLLKKPSLDPNVLKNYRPISNLPFLSKVIEKVVAQRLFAHMTENNLHENSNQHINHATALKLHYLGCKMTS